jgi:hypothetical protein
MIGIVCRIDEAGPDVGPRLDDRDLEGLRRMARELDRGARAAEAATDDRDGANLQLPASPCATGQK